MSSGKKRMADEGNADEEERQLYGYGRAFDNVLRGPQHGAPESHDGETAGSGDGEPRVRRVTA